jgi:hypothetical protein
MIIKLTIGHGTTLLDDHARSKGPRARRHRRDLTKRITRGYRKFNYNQLQLLLNQAESTKTTHSHQQSRSSSEIFLKRE